jgi:hypothetical protein
MCTALIIVEYKILIKSDVELRPAVALKVAS